ncbi:MAG: orotidine-5'-phosphate decarboxylase [Thermoplasmatales archaeon]|nr:orotidine-5'-phosphate decarboxylase [Candidatus Thermoplasmatota archaeon]MDA8055187.1 orotidine-5'-phosphate decarboxylase [Thermoplasmatales archaeon]
MESNIILALDIEEKDKALRVAKEVVGHVKAFKVGYPLILNYGVNVINEVSKFGEVIVDLKIADIPDVSRNIARIVTSNGGEGVIAHGFVGRDVIREVRKESKKLYVVAEMSHPGNTDFMSGLSEKIAIMAKEEGADGIVAPATHPDRIRILKRVSGLQVLSPGVGTQGGSYRGAMESGADYLIIGRSITMSSDPKQKIKELLSQR